MEDVHGTQKGQAALWNSTAGRGWVEAQELIDRVFQAFEDALVDVAAAGGGRHVLEVGCGTGGVTLAAARALGAEGRAVGIDISETMIAAASGRAEKARAEWKGAPVSFICADAETYAFRPASFDAIISRFGVMFFGDSVRAFANLRRAAKEDAELRFITWRSPDDNPFMTTAERAAAPLLPDLPARDPDAPGQFAFADAERIRRILDESGWRNIDIAPLDVSCAFPETALVGYFTRLGPVGRALPSVDERARAEIIEKVRAAFEPYVHGAEVRFTAACWMVGARAPAAS